MTGEVGGVPAIWVADFRSAFLLRCFEGLRKGLRASEFAASRRVKCHSCSALRPTLLAATERPTLAGRTSTITPSWRRIAAMGTRTPCSVYVLKLHVRFACQMSTGCAIGHQDETKSLGTAFLWGLKAMRYWGSRVPPAL
jgi:hypothetical protein